jgi:hypothetical protein
MRLRESQDIAGSRIGRSNTDLIIRSSRFLGGEQCGVTVQTDQSHVQDKTKSSKLERG